jgi:hypothetical protein
MCRIVFALLLAGACSTLFAQSTAGRTSSITIARSQGEIRLDGRLEEAAWQSVEKASHFRYNFPVDTGYTTTFSEAGMCFDDKYLYIGIRCTQPDSTYTIQSFKRDFPAGTSDVFNVALCPSRDGLNGFLFSVNPYNVQRETLISFGDNLEFEWDNKWYSAVHNETDAWTIEMAIPFKTLRYSVQEGENVWHINFIRTRLQPWEISTWQPVPQQYSGNNLAFCAPLIWASPPPAPRRNVSVIPYIRSGFQADYQRDANLEIRQIKRNYPAGAGADAKIALTPSLNLDLTINPDFSQVEVDRQVANLSRFELFFPERRQFFLENRDLFATYGFPSTRPFFSRRIGLARNPVSGFNESIPILAGARLSGKLDNNWRVGLLNMQTRRRDWDSLQVLPSANFTVVTLQRKVFERSALGAVFVNKANQLGPLSAEQQQGLQPWNRVAGLEYNLYSKDNRWEGEWYYHRSFSPDPGKRGQTLAHFLGFNDRYWSARLGYVLVDSTYTADAGFVPRIGYQGFFPGIQRRFYPAGKRINTYGFGIDGDLTYSLFFKPTDRELYLYTDIQFKNLSSINVGVYNSYTYIFEDFDPSQQENGKALPAQTGYSYSGVSGEMASSSTYDLQGSLEFSLGEFFNGYLWSAGGELSYRWQPYGVFAMGFTYNDIQLPAPYSSARLWLLGPRAELAFSRKLFVSGFFQYNTQSNNFNVNARLQWRFAPVSDIYLVYTDNSFARAVEMTPVRIFSPKNKALVFKIVYWLNL